MRISLLCTLLLEGPETKVLSSLTNAGRIVWDGAGDLALLGVLHNLLAVGVRRLQPHLDTATSPNVAAEVTRLTSTAAERGRRRKE